MIIENFTNLTDILSLQAEQRSDFVAIDTPDKSISYSELDILVSKTALYLYNHNVKSGNVIAVELDDEFKHILVMLAIAKIGATYISIPGNTPDVLYARILKETGFSMLLTATENRRGIDAPILLMDLDSIKNIPIPKNDTIYNPLPDASWQIALGSGSTGKSKLMPYTHLQEIVRAEISAHLLPITEDDRVASLITIDFSDTKRRFLETIYAGATFVVLDRDNLEINDLAKKYRITVLRSTVFHIESLLKTLSSKDREVFSFLKILSIGTAPVSDKLRERILKHLTANLFITFGTSETGTITVADLSKAQNISGSVGRPYDGVLVEIVDTNDHSVKRGIIGEIRIKSPGTINGYLNDEEATQKAFKNGWFYPGDLGKFTEDGQLIHLGRADHMMIMNGINIYPAEIEQIITSHPEVEDAAAMPIKSSIHQDIPVCAVVLSLNSKLTEKVLLEYTYQRLGARGPKRVIVLDVIPRNEQGKLIRQELTDAINLELSTSGRSNVAPKKNTIRKYTQTILPFTIRMKRDLPKNLEHIDEWLTSVLGIDIEPLPYSICSADAKTQNHTLAFVWRILLLSRTLLQSIRVPLFDPGEIRNINESDSKYYGITVGMVQIDHIPQNVYIKSLHTASNIILNFMKKPITAENRKILFEALKKEFITPLSHLSGSGKSTMPILREAHKRNIPFKHLKNGVYQLGWGSRSRRMNRSSTERDSLIGGMMSHSKMVTAALVRDAGLPSPVHNMVRSKEEALSVVKDLGWPIVVKPADSDRGEGVTVDVTDDTTLIEAFSFAKDASKAKQIIIEQQVDGICCRVFIAGQKMLYAVMRLPKSVKGNGKNSVQELIDAANRIEAEMPPWKKSEPFPLDAMAIKAMGASGSTLESVPKQDQLVPLRRIESTQWGGVDEDVTDTIHPDNIDLALRAAKLFGLHVAGIDIITPDITVPWYENGAILNEVNVTPLFGGGEISRRAIPYFLDNFIQGDGRIPITVITGGTDAMERALAMQKEKVAKGIHCFVSSHQKSIDWTGEEVHFTSNSLQDRCRALLMDSRVEALILVVRTEKY